ncbi:nuclear transport factor 2 family protein [Vibrio sp. SCSIO 43135]|jgi:ketosteroid isomerase-like protein|uniref:YybH family protein n=1 Tax=Vibrio sp. SCSIO 43135 TaxID=2819096 RepID=UPI002075CCD2|nr:nuclear transport factor 2 family protein [Vibrio sp. SCSIO 43135]USD43776.1 nuclear transport factor 2 family protein [Vibrio sp. SCSIO 43135]
MNNSVLDACKAGISAWQSAFNQGNAKGCAQQYAEGTTMVAKPFGTFVGREAIENFWQGIIDQGFSNVEYQDVEWTAEGEDGFILTSSWTMNKAYGVVHKEHWKLQADGKARLEYDEFEVLGER